MLYRTSMLLFSASCLIVGCGENLVASLKGEEWNRHSNIDLQEIAETSICKRLISFGFTEKPKNSGEYIAEMKLGRIMELFGLKEENLYPFPSAGAGDGVWARNTKIEGNWTLLSCEIPSSMVGPETSITIRVNLEYTRPKMLFVGMAVARFEAALKFIGAESTPVRPLEVLPPILNKVGSAYGWLLPDKTGIVVTCDSPYYSLNSSRISSPTKQLNFPIIYDILVGPAGKGFDDWNPSAAKSVDRLPIQKYRAAKDRK
jgi:hypothetical protein